MKFFMDLYQLIYPTNKHRNIHSWSQIELFFCNIFTNNNNKLYHQNDL